MLVFVDFQPFLKQPALSLLIYGKELPYELRYLNQGVFVLILFSLLGFK